MAGVLFIGGTRQIWRPAASLSPMPGARGRQSLASCVWQPFLLTSVMGLVFFWLSLNQVDMLWSWNQTY